LVQTDIKNKILEEILTTLNVHRLIQINEWIIFYITEDGLNQSKYKGNKAFLSD
jgi:hypothetical protein